MGKSGSFGETSVHLSVHPVPCFPSFFFLQVQKICKHLQLCKMERSNYQIIQLTSGKVFLMVGQVNTGFQQYFSFLLVFLRVCYQYFAIN